MLFVVCCCLIVVCCLLIVLCCLFCVDCRSLLVVACCLFLVYCLCCSLFVVRCSLFVVCCLLFVFCVYFRRSLLFVACFFSFDSVRVVLSSLVPRFLYIVFWFLVFGVCCFVVWPSLLVVGCWLLVYVLFWCLFVF